MQYLPFRLELFVSVPPPDVLPEREPEPEPPPASRVRAALRLHPPHDDGDDSADGRHDLPVLLPAEVRGHGGRVGGGVRAEGAPPVGGAVVVGLPACKMKKKSNLCKILFY